MKDQTQNSSPMILPISPLFVKKSYKKKRKESTTWIFLLITILCCKQQGFHFIQELKWVAVVDIGVDVDHICSLCLTIGR